MRFKFLKMYIQSLCEGLENKMCEIKKINKKMAEYCFKVSRRVLRERIGGNSLFLKKNHKRKIKIKG